MGIGLGTHGRLKARARGPQCASLTILVLTAVVGCGTRHTEQAPATSRSGGESPAQATVVATAEEPATHLLASKPAGSFHRISLSDRRCIRFEPQWTSVHLGQSVIWHSDLKTPIRIYVSPGVFDKLSFLVRPGATVSTGPAHLAGRFSLWTEPSACQDMPLGVALGGPGVTVQETFYASNSGPR